jgi:hypothetical protein
LIDLDKQSGTDSPNQLIVDSNHLIDAPKNFIIDGSDHVSSAVHIGNHESGGSETLCHGFGYPEVNTHGSDSSEVRGTEQSGKQNSGVKSGTYFNPGSYNFEEALNSAIYVDKTELIWYLNSLVRTRQKYVSVSRPRRFGKTMAADMLCAYYGAGTDRHELFSNLKLSHCEDITVGRETLSWDAYLGKFDVLRIVMTDFIRNCRHVRDMLTALTTKLCNELKNAYPRLRFYDGADADLVDVMNVIHSATGRQFVVIIDEWDAIFRIRKEDKDGQTEYLNFLRDWLKDKPYIALAYMTGILPIKKYGEHSALNMFTEYSMIAPMQMAKFTGFTDEEVRELCERHCMDYEAVSNWYDGYLVSDRLPENKRKTYREGGYVGHQISLYSPLSVVSAVTTGYIRNYWNKTETYEALAEYIRRDYDGLKESVALLMDGGRLKIDTSTYQNDMTTFHSRDDVLSLLIHLGYLGYDSEQEEVFIPNREILDEFKTSTKADAWTDVFKSFELSVDLLKATWNRDEKKVAELIEKAHDRAANNTYNNEAALNYSIQYAYYAAQKYYTMIPELDSGKGYADIAFIPAPKYADKPALIIELKYEKDVDSAVTQIKQKKYPERLEHYKGNILLVGINYEKSAGSDSIDFKHHTCKIERV